MRPTISRAVRRALDNCSAMVPFSPARIRELPPTARRMVFIVSLRLAPRLAPKERARTWGTFYRYFLHVRQIAQFGQVGQFHELTFHSFEHDGLLRVQAVLRLLKYQRLRRINHVCGYLVAAMGGEAVQENCVALGVPEQIFIDLIGSEQAFALFPFGFLAHAGPDI